MQVISTEDKRAVIEGYRNALPPTDRSDEELWAEFLADRKKSATMSDIMLLYVGLHDAKAYIDRSLDEVYDRLDGKAAKARVRVPAGETKWTQSDYQALVELAAENRRRAMESGGMYFKAVIPTEEERQRLVTRDQQVVASLIAKARYRVKAKSAPYV